MEINEDKIIENVDEELALACLLAADVLFINVINISSGSIPEFTTCVYVDASDIFMWGCADAESITSNDHENPSEIIELYKLWKENEVWGRVKWLCFKRDIQPQRPVKDLMIKANYWDEGLDKLPLNPDSKI